LKYNDNEHHILQKELNDQMLRLRIKVQPAPISNNSLQSLLGMALSFFTHFNIFFRFLIAKSAGLLIYSYLNKKQRIIKTSLNDTW